MTEPRDEIDATPRSPKPYEMEEGGRARRDGWLIFGVVFAGVSLLASIFSWGMAARAETEAKSVRAGGAGPAGAAGAQGPAKKTSMVHLSELQIDPTVIKATVGDILEVMNVGTMTHNLAVDGQTLATPMINAGGAAELHLDGLAPGTYTVYCQVAGHREAGMHAQLVLSAASGSSAAAAPAAGMTPGLLTR
jgi:plastocyanin